MSERTRQKTIPPLVGITQQRELKFNGRTFLLASHSAYKIGSVIDTTINGIAILDTDNRKVLIAGHKAKNMTAEYKRICNMDWESFRHLVKLPAE